jgi:hypothetical protein
MMSSTHASSLVTHRSHGGADRDRTDDLRLAKPALSQLSYSPEVNFVSEISSSSFNWQPMTINHWPRRSHPPGHRDVRNGEAGSNQDLLQKTSRLNSFKLPLFMVGLGRVELPTSPLSGVRSNQLSYRPVSLLANNYSLPAML